MFCKIRNLLLGLVFGVLGIGSLLGVGCAVIWYLGVGLKAIGLFDQGEDPVIASLTFLALGSGLVVGTYLLGDWCISLGEQIAKNLKLPSCTPRTK